MNESQVKWLYNHYSNKKVSILEGVMGFYDGENKGCSAYSISKLLNIPTILIIDASGSYITVSAVLKGLITYKDDNTIKAIVLNNISSKMHYDLIKKQIQIDHSGIIVAGWIKKNLNSLNNTHLGLDLKDKNKIKQISKEILEHIDINILTKIGKTKHVINNNYPFKQIKKINKELTIVTDINFSFLYYDNLKFLKEIFRKVIIVDSTRDEKIPKTSDIVYICGGYIETSSAYQRIKNSKRFRKSLIKHSLKKKIYAECAGLLYLGNKVNNKKMSSILNINFTLEKRFTRLGYYYNEQGIKGHSFHYTKPTEVSNGFDILSKIKNGKGEVGSWSNKKVFGTYFHTMFRNNFEQINTFSLSRYS
jgi:cobyrinic acid a,c-diamide synthase